MRKFVDTPSHTSLHIGLICALCSVIFYTDFFTPLGFAHGILYLPVVIYAMALEDVSDRFQKLVLAIVLIGIALGYVFAFEKSNLPDIFIFSNRALSAGILVLTYFYCQKLRTIKEQYIEIKNLELSQRQNLTDFIEAMPIQVWSAEANGTIDFVSTSLTAFSGKTKEAILKDWLALLHPDDREKTVDVWTRSIRTGEPYEVDFRLRRHDGQYIWFHTRAVPQRDSYGNIRRWLGSSNDIDDMRRMREDAQHLAAQFRLTVESITDAFFTLDHEFRFTYLNQNAAKVLGNSIDELLGEVIWEKCGMEYDSPFAIHYRVAAEEQRTIHFEEFFRPDNKWLQVHTYPSPYGLTVYFADISEQRNMEQQLRESQKMEAVGQLTGGVAHDFNNLLTIILGNAEILQEELSDLPHLQRLAKMSLDAADRGADLTSRLLAFSRKQALEPKLLDVAPLIQGMDGLLRRALPESIDIEIVRSGGLWKIEADKTQLESALLNLAVNARDAMPNGGSLTIEMANAMLDDNYVAMEPDVRPGQYMVIIVTDTGTGMPPDVLARVFEPFFTTKEVGKGSGLGLSMVFGFVKQSGGHIRIYSELNEGTAIKMYFPRSRRDQENATVASPLVKVTGGAEKILVVEDDCAVREYVSAQLHSLGYRVLEVAKGAEAIEIFKQTADIDLLFTDVVMPGGMGGRELADAACKLQPNLKVLFTSGYTENSIVHQGRLDPDVKLLNKPYRREQLALKIREALDAQDESEPCRGISHFC